MADLCERSENNQVVPNSVSNLQNARRRYRNHQNQLRNNANVRDEHAIFGDFVAAKLRNLDERFLRAVKHRIEQVLMQAERAHPNNVCPPLSRNPLNANLNVLDVAPMPVFTPQFPIYPVSPPFVRNQASFIPFPNMPIVDIYNYASPFVSATGIRTNVPALAVSPQFPNFLNLPMVPPIINNNFQPPLQQQLNLNVPSGSRARPKRSVHNAEPFNQLRNFGRQRHQQRRGSGSSSLFRNNSHLADTNESSNSR